MSQKPSDTPITILESEQSGKYGSDREASAKKALADIEAIRKRECLRRKPQEHEWRLALAFLSNEHWVTVNRITGQIDRALDDAKLPPHQQKAKIPFISNAVSRLLAKLTKTDPTWQAMPTKASQSALRSAQLAEAMFEQVRRDQGFPRKLQEVLLWMFSCGHGFMHVYWDDQAGEEIRYAISPYDGEPVVNQELLQELQEREALGEFELEWRTVHNGDVGIEVLAPQQVILLGGRTPEEAHTAFITKALDPDWVRMRWGKAIEPDVVEEEFAVGSKTNGGEKQLVQIHHLLVKPTVKNRAGRYLVYANENTILYDGPFPYKHGELPLARFSGTILPHRKYELSIVSGMISLQRFLNRSVTRIFQHHNLTALPRIRAPKGQIVTKITTKPGQVIEYNNVYGGAKPEYMEQPNAPSSQFKEVDLLLEQLNEASGQSSISQTDVPPGLESAAALGLLIEHDESRIGPLHDNMEQALSRVGMLVLKTATQFYVTERKIKVAGIAGILSEQEFIGDDLALCDDIRIVPGSSRSKSAAVKAQLAMQLMQTGQVDAREVLPALEGMGLDFLTMRWEQDRQRQREEIQIFRETGEFPPVEDFDDGRAHIEALDEIMKSPRWFLLSAEEQDAFRQHRQAHEQALAAKAPKPEVKAPNTTLQLRGEASGEVIAAILGNQSVEIDAGEIVEAQKDDEEHKAELEAQVKVLAEQARQQANADVPIEELMYG